MATSNRRFSSTRHDQDMPAAIVTAARADGVLPDLLAAVAAADELMELDGIHGTSPPLGRLAGPSLGIGHGNTGTVL
jgi:hypothetical protein